LLFRVLADSELSSKDTEDGLKDRRKLLEPGLVSVAAYKSYSKSERMRSGITVSRKDVGMTSSTPRYSPTLQNASNPGPDESQGNYPVLPADRDVGRDSTLDIHPEIVIPKSRE